MSKKVEFSFDAINEERSQVREQKSGVQVPKLESLKKPKNNAEYLRQLAGKIERQIIGGCES